MVGQEELRSRIGVCGVWSGDDACSLRAGRGTLRHENSKTHSTSDGKCITLMV